jgi:hypothetical protein
MGNLTLIISRKHNCRKCGNRLKNNYFILPAGAGGLDKESVIDLTRYFEGIPESLFNKYKADIEKNGSLIQDYVNKLVKYIKCPARAGGN